MRMQALFATLERENKERFVMRTQALLLAMLLASAPLPSFAQDFDAGLAAYNNGDYTTALREWRPLAERGNARAQADLGFFYYKGQGVLQDFAEAVRWYRLAAEQGDEEAQYDIGNMYLLGHGVKQSYETAHMWFNIAAANGHNRAAERREMVAGFLNEQPRTISEAQRRARVCMASNYQDCDQASWANRLWQN